VSQRADNGLKTAAYWRERAEEARVLAEGMNDPTARATMEDIAHKYDVMAELAERREPQAR
jgi:hypothetical protein